MKYSVFLLLIFISLQAGGDEIDTALITLSQKLRSDIIQCLGVAVIDQELDKIWHDDLIKAIETDFKYEVYTELFCALNGFGDLEQIKKWQEHSDDFDQLSDGDKEKVAQLIVGIQWIQNKMSKSCIR